MNKIYEEQLKLNRFKLDESGSGNVWSRKSVSRLNIPQGNPVAPSARQVKRTEKVQNPEEPQSKLADYTGTDLAWDVAGTVDPTGVVDLVNAGRYAAKGQYADAAISLAGAVPVVGDLAKGARAVKAATKAVHTGEVIGRAASKASKPEIAQAAADMLRRKMGKPKVTVQPAKTGALATVKRNAASAAVGAAAATATNAAVEYAKRKIKDYSEDDGDSDRKKRIIPHNDPIPDIGLNLQRLSAFDPGEPSGYSKSMVHRRGMEGLPQGYHPYFTGPVNVDLERRRSYYAQRHAIPESTDIKNKIKQSVDSYLKSKEGKALINHLDSIRNTLAKI